MKGEGKGVDAPTAAVPGTSMTERGKEKSRSKDRGSSRVAEAEKEAEVVAGSVKSSKRSGKRPAATTSYSRSKKTKIAILGDDETEALTEEEVLAEETAAEGSQIGEETLYWQRLEFQALSTMVEAKKLARAFANIPTLRRTMDIDRSGPGVEAGIGIVYRGVDDNTMDELGKWTRSQVVGLAGLALSDISCIIESLMREVKVL